MYKIAHFGVNIGMHIHTFHLPLLKTPNNGEPRLNRTDTLSRFVPSGANVLPVPSAPLVYNGGVKGDAVAAEGFFAGPDAEAEAFDFAQQAAPGILKSDIKPMDDGEMCSVGDALLTLASNLAAKPPDLVIFPLRAGHRIREIMTGMLPAHPPFASVEFSEAASRPNDGFYRDLLVQAIRQHNPENEELKLVIVDVGDSGKGTEKMLQLLREIHAAGARRQSWLVEFHVFHAHGQSWNFKQHERLYGAKFLAVVETYQTFIGTKLLDDWSAALGLEKVRRKVPGGEVFVPATMEAVRPAALIIKTPAGYRTLASKVGKHVGNIAISHYTTDALKRSPRLVRQPQFDLWKE